jgi:hypothetical protein
MEMNESNYCQFCGSEITIGDKFCNNCGASLKEEKPSAKIVTSLSSSSEATRQPPIKQKPATTNVDPPKKSETAKLVFGIMGLGLGIITAIAFLILMSLSSFVILIIIYFPILTIPSIVFSAISVRTNIAIGVFGLIVNILALIGEIVFILVLFL